MHIFSIFICIASAVSQFLILSLDSLYQQHNRFISSFIGIIFPCIVPRTTWCSLCSLNIVMIYRGTVWPRQWKSIWTCMVNLLGLRFDSKQPQHKSSKLSIQHTRPIKKLSRYQVTIYGIKITFIILFERGRKHSDLWHGLSLLATCPVKRK